MTSSRHAIRCGAAALVAALGVCTPMGHGQDIDRLLPDAEPGAAAVLDLPGSVGEGEDFDGAGEVLVDELAGVAVVSAPGTPPIRQAAKLEKELRGWVGEPLTLGGLVELADTVVAHYNALGFPVVDVAVPEQEVTSGSILLVVTEGKVGQVGLAGGEHFDRDRLARAIRSQTGEPLTTRVLYGDLDWLNRNRFLDATLAVAPGADVAEADLLFAVSDQRPFRFFGGFENSGVDVVGEERWLTGFEWGDVFGLGHRMVYQATVGTDVDAFRAHALDYRLPLPWRHELGFQAAFARSDVAIDDPTADQTAGKSWLLGAGYTVPLPRAFGGALRHELAAGFEWKSTNNNLEFGGVEVFDSNAEIGQFIGRYGGTFERGSASTSFAGAFIFSPGDLGGDNTDAAFSTIRADAVSEYIAARGAVRHVQRFDGGTNLVLRAGGQWTDAPLLPSEQLALGGHDTVRGYGEREELGDLGYYGSVEIRSPVIPGPVAERGRWQVLVFADYGRAWSEVGHGADTELSSAGPGLRYGWGENFSLRFDYGWKLDGDGSRAHIGARFEF